MSYVFELFWKVPKTAIFGHFWPPRSGPKSRILGPDFSRRIPRNFFILPGLLTLVLHFTLGIWKMSKTSSSSSSSPWHPESERSSLSVCFWMLSSRVDGCIFWSLRWSTARSWAYRGTWPSRHFHLLVSFRLKKRPESKPSRLSNSLNRH